MRFWAPKTRNQLWFAAVCLRLSPQSLLALLVIKTLQRFQQRLLPLQGGSGDVGTCSWMRRLSPYIPSEADGDWCCKGFVVKSAAPSRAAHAIFPGKGKLILHKYCKVGCGELLSPSLDVSHVSHSKNQHHFGNISMWQGVQVNSAGPSWSLLSFSILFSFIINFFPFIFLKALPARWKKLSVREMHKIKKYNSSKVYMAVHAMEMVNCSLIQVERVWLLFHFFIITLFFFSFFGGEGGQDEGCKERHRRRGEFPAWRRLEPAACPGCFKTVWNVR